MNKYAMNIDHVYDRWFSIKQKITKNKNIKQTILHATTN